jgi:hypothetical protein
VEFYKPAFNSQSDGCRHGTHSPRATWTTQGDSGSSQQRALIYLTVALLRLRIGFAESFLIALPGSFFAVMALAAAGGACTLSIGMILTGILIRDNVEWQYSRQ